MKMNKILLTMLFVIVLFASVLSFVSAGGYIGVINNVSGIYINDFTAGSITTANFSFNYEDYSGINQYPHVLQINISSNDTNYPVWKGDFQIWGFVRKSTFFGLYHTDVSFKCNESSPLTIKNIYLGVSKIQDVPNGTFYCYNETSGIIENLVKSDKVYLNIKSNSALWPGQYDLSAGIFSLSDDLAPFVNITNKNSFNNKYYRALNNIEVRANITDGSPIADKWGTIFTPTQNITVPFSYKDGGIYHFTKVLPTEMPEGDWNMSVFATDTSGNLGNDSVTLRIDNTGPTITLVQPNGSVYSGMLTIEANVTDAKSGVNDSSVQYRLREMNGTNICQDNGVGTWDCYNSGWLSLPNTSGDLFKTDINTTQIGLNGEYWLEIRAHDVLGNEGVLE